MSILIVCLLRIMSSTMKISSSELLLPLLFFPRLPRCCFSCLWLPFCRRLFGFLPAPVLAFFSLFFFVAVFLAADPLFLRLAPAGFFGAAFFFRCMLLLASRRLLGFRHLNLWFSCSWCLLLLGSWSTAGRRLTWSRALVSCRSLLPHDSRVVMMHMRRTALENVIGFYNDLYLLAYVMSSVQNVQVYKGTRDTIHTL